MKKKAVALKKITQEIKVVGKGEGYIAKKIIEVAEEHDIPIKSDRELVEKLFAVELYDDVPEELYEYIVKVLDFLYNIRK
ncbi:MULTISPECIES: EscU/YscU/HrcU family type III secretion system export apparatus switch protein [Nitratiruptor]|uniref:Flagellar biosynthesis protein n=1 Tax=Nitratiruptor tergarcus DSM 16512 TaxID=1069081 RepID=A0A1W1WUC3_9BACT|nr:MULTISPECIES: EscU/YscU/HrcU family type III secretion system export apparatus switch protein [Nitratiruptor]BCD62513.1 flagellar biosynthesis protein [Nitratiruptor sp. YY08-13]BCD66449.1 flagellar biosynthesis protein [Nitratiruptor sp. YY08-26]SMC09924.1 flagellar biosynthesis protein [Nitratiruptor tergarcus DSM 16512]